MAWQPSRFDDEFCVETALAQMSTQLDPGLKQPGSEILDLALSTAGVTNVFGLPQTLNLAYFSCKVDPVCNSNAATSF